MNSVNEIKYALISLFREALITIWLKNPILFQNLINKFIYMVQGMLR